MTREEILKLEPGPELDRLVAERVMEWVEGEHFVLFGKRGYVRSLVGEDWMPSVDMLAAMDVLDRLLNIGFIFDVMSPRPGYSDDWRVCVWLWRKGQEEKLVADEEAYSLPLAICRAALLAVRATQGKVIEDGNVKPFGG